MLLSHLLLDLFTGAGVPLMYPFAATTFGFTCELTIAHGSLVLLPEPPVAFVQSKLLGIALTSLVLATIVFVKDLLPLQKDIFRVLEHRVRSSRGRSDALLAYSLVSPRSIQFGAANGSQSFWRQDTKLGRTDYFWNFPVRPVINRALLHMPRKS